MLPSAGQEGGWRGPVKGAVGAGAELGSTWGEMGIGAEGGVSGLSGLGEVRSGVVAAAMDALAMCMRAGVALR